MASGASSEATLPDGITNQEALIGVLASKADSLGSQVTSLLPHMENFIGVAVAILVGAVTLGVTQKHPVILVLLPFPLIILFAYLLQANTEMLSRAGHKRFLEETVNKLLQRRVLLEESDVAPKTLHGTGPLGALGRPSIAMVQGFMVLLLCGAIVLGITHLSSVKGSLGLVAFWVSLTAGVAMLILAAVEQMHAYDGGYEAAKAGFEGAPEPISVLTGK
jgi:hypothetical protein